VKLIAAGMLAALTLLVTACGSEKQGGSPRVTASVQIAPSVSSAPSACPVPVSGTASPSSGSSSCQLAVAEFSSAPGQPLVAHGGGFLNLASATYSADPTAQIVPLADPRKQGGWKTVAQPVLVGDGGPTYDSTLRRWLPVPASNVSPDGTHYVYEDFVLPPGVTPSTGPVVYLPRLHVVDLTDGQDRVVPSGSLPTAVGVVSYQADGIYLTSGCPEGCPADANKLWHLDPKNGIVTKITDLQGNGWMIANGSAWSAIDEAPAGSTPRFEVVSVRLSDRSSSRWLAVTPPCTSSCRAPDAVGVDADGNLLVELWIGDSVHLDRVTAPEQAEELVSLVAQSEGSPYFIGGVVDHLGTWLGTRQGLFMYSPAQGLRKVSGMPVIPASGGVQA
jgi:hypothetical protein